MPKFCVFSFCIVSLSFIKALGEYRTKCKNFPENLYSERCLVPTNRIGLCFSLDGRAMVFLGIIMVMGTVVWTGHWEGYCDFQLDLAPHGKP